MEAEDAPARGRSRSLTGDWTEPKALKAGVDGAAPCAVGPKPRRKRLGALAGAGIALLASAASAVGWVGEAGLLFVVIGFAL